MSVSSTIFQPSELLTLLHRYQLMPSVWREIVIDREIATISCTSAEREDAIARFCQRHQLHSHDARNAWYQRHQLTLEAMEERAVRSVRIEKLKAKMWGRQLESYFLQRKADLDRVVYSLIRTQDRWLAQELYFRLLEGETTFSELAQQYSYGPEAGTWGLRGPVPLTQPHPTIRRLLVSSQSGQLCPPQAIADWFVIVRLERLLPAQLDGSMRQRLLNECFEIWLQKQIQSLSMESGWPSIGQEGIDTMPIHANSM
jgi:hypothetical protein